MESEQKIAELEARLKEQAITPEYIDTANALSFELLLKLKSQERKRAYGLAKEAELLSTERFPEHRKGLTEALINLALHQTTRPDFKEAMRLILQAGVLADELEDGGLVALKQLMILRYVYTVMGDYTAAIETSLRRLKQARRLGHEQEEMKACEALAYDCFRVKEYQQALDHSKQALELATRLGDEPMIAHAHMNVTYPLRELGDHGAALEHALQAYRYFEGQKSRLESITLGVIGLIHLETQRFEEALAYFERELEIVQALDDAFLLAHNHCEIGRVHLSSGQTTEAIKWLEAGTGLAESHHLKAALLDNYPYLVEAHKANNHHRDALAVFEKLAELEAEENSTRAMNHRNLLLITHETEQAQLNTALERERAEALRMESEKLAQQYRVVQRVNHLKDQLVSTASHDLRNPLSVISLELGVLEQRNRGNLAVVEAAQRMLSGVRRVNELISSTLDFSDLENRMKPKFESADMVALVRDVLDQQRVRSTAKRISVAVDVPGEPVSMTFDHGQITRVLENLLSNAIKYTSEGGELFISLEASPETATLTIKDTGRGIPAQEVARVFDYEFRASNSGSETGHGYGLSIVKNVIDDHGGKIVCRSQENVGTSFIVTLPRKVGQKTASAVGT